MSRPQSIGGPGRTTHKDDAEARFGPIIDRLALSPLHDDYVRGRWLDQVRWMDGRARSCQAWYYRLRVTAIAGGLLIPALVGIDLTGDTAVWVKGLLLVLGLVVALATSLEGFFRFGDRWRHYRQTVEALKSEGWQFFQLGGPYADAPDHAEAFAGFAARVETVLAEDVATFITQVTKQKDETGKPPDGGGG